MNGTTAKAVSPTIDSFLSWWKGDERFLALLPPLDGIKADRAVEQKRAFTLMDWVVREFSPTWLSQVGPRYRDWADALRRLPRIDSWEALARTLPGLIQASRLAHEHMKRIFSETSTTDAGLAIDARDALWGVTKPGRNWWHLAMWAEDPALKAAFQNKAIKRRAQIVWGAAKAAAVESARNPDERPDAWAQIQAAARHAALHPKTYRYDDEIGGEVPDRELDLTRAAPATREAALTLGLLAAEDGTRLAASEEVSTLAGEAFHAEVFPGLVEAMRAAAAGLAEPEEVWGASMEVAAPLVEKRWQEIMAQLQEPAARMIERLVKVS